MDWRAARAAAAALLIGGLGLLGGSGPRDAHSLGSTARGVERAPANAVELLNCPDPLVIQASDGSRRLVCRRADAQLLLTLCPPRSAVHRGDRLSPSPALVGCRSVARPLSAGHRLRLGLPLHVNRASADALTAVAGIGPVTAGRIVAGRPWTSVADLRAVRGLGAKRLARIAPQLTSSPSPRPLWPSPPPRGASSLRRP